eukprot:3886086-Rhodomonas_salina.1
MLAARSGTDEPNKRLVQWMVRERADVTKTNKFGQTALECAALLGNFDVVKLLLEAEANYDMDVSKAKAGKGDGTTLLMCAAESGQEEMVKWLAMNQDIADINQKTTSKKTLLQITAERGQLGLAQWLVAPERAERFKSGPANPNQCNKDQETPLMMAASNGHEDFVTWLADKHKVNMDTKDKNGQTALLQAAANGREAVVRALAHRKANLWETDSNNNTALHLAARNGLEGLLRWLVLDENLNLEAMNDDGETPFLCAAAEGREGAMRWLKENGANVDAKRTDGRTALMLLVEKEQERLVGWMTQSTGVDANAADSNGRTALMYAAERGFVEVAKQLAMVDRNESACRLNIGQKDFGGSTALIYAVKNRRQEMLKWLLKDRGANADASNAEGWTPLTLTVAHGTKEELKWMIQEGRASLGGVDISERGRRVRVPLIVAVERSPPDEGLKMVKGLEKYGDLTVRDTRDLNGMTPLMAWAAVKEKTDSSKGVDVTKESARMFKYLLEQNAEVNAVDNFGNTALMYAVSSRLEGKVQALVEQCANAEQTNKLGWNALHLALETKQQDSLRSLLPAAKSEAVQQELEQLRTALPAVIHRGAPLSAHLEASQRRVTFVKFSTIRSRDPFPSTAPPYYELTIREPLLDPRVGFASGALTPCTTDTDLGVGDDGTAWGVGRSMRTQACLVACDEGEQLDPGDLSCEMWAMDDVIGLKCDLAAKEMSVWRNGEQWPKDRAVFKIGSESQRAPQQLFAAFSAKSGAVEFNFGDKAFSEFAPRDCMSVGGAASVAQACAKGAVMAAREERTRPE